MVVPTSKHKHARSNTGTCTAETSAPPIESHRNGEPTAKSPIGKEDSLQGMDLDVQTASTNNQIMVDRGKSPVMEVSPSPPSGVK